MNRLHELQEQGQSVWLDYIERTMIADGELQQLVADGISGVTSNPTIFQAAISGSDAYTADLQRLVGGESSAKTIFERLAISDIQAAADILRPVYDRAQKADGFVSLEVAPDLAYDTEATVSEARRLWSALDRPNVMIKVPATEAGLDAIRRLTADGINVNVTLIFSIERYAAVKEAYLAGLEERVRAGKPVEHIASVASFFVSRVDTLADSKLEELAAAKPEVAERARALLGKIAVANAKLAYAQFERVFSGPRWQALAEAGAHVQRPLWASTSTKNPAYPDLLYVEPLIGPHTVNTMPPKTIEAVRDHGVVARTIGDGVEEARAQVAELAALGLDLDQITDELEQEGVKKFADSFTDLLGAIEQRRRELVGAG